MIASVLHTLAERLPSTQECRQASTSACSFAARQSEEILRLLTPLLPATARTSLSTLNACFAATGDPGAGFRLLAEEVAHAETCVRPGVGETGVVPTPNAAANPVAPPRFRLSQPTANGFVAEVYAPFTPADKSAALTAHTSSCLNSYAPRLTGPNAERLSIRLVTDPGSPAIPANPIEVLPPGSRSHSSAWKEDIDCATILHEMLHVLGLIDEYEERWMGYHSEGGQLKSTGLENFGEVPIRSYNCRSHGPESSVMYYQTYAVAAAGSLLSPAHFRAITQPGCAAANRLYYACTRDAYVTSSASLGEGCSRNTPPECRNASEWLR
jgi:hypothetical protein